MVIKFSTLERLVAQTALRVSGQLAFVRWPGKIKSTTLPSNAKTSQQQESCHATPLPVPHA